MKKFFSFFAALLFAGSMMAGSYTISFKDNGEGQGDSSASLTSTNVADYVAEGAEYFSAVAATGKVYLGQGGYGLKFGNSSNAGSITLTLVTPVTPTSIVMNACPWSATEGSGLLQDSIFATKSTGAKGTFADFTYYYDGASQVTTIVVGTEQKRGYVKSITVNYEGGVTPPSVATPVISGEAEFTDSVIVTITCSTPETDIYYTTDGTTDPKCDCSAAPEYTHEIVLKETTTIMAAAYTGNDWSAVATKTFTKVVPPVNLGEKTIAEFLTLKNVKDTCILTGVVDSIKNTQYGNLYLSDATGQVYVYGVLNAAGESKKFAELGVDVNDTLTIKAIYSEFNNAPQVKNAIFVSVKKAQGVVPPTPAEKPEYYNVAEAIAAADAQDIKANDSIVVRGVVTKLEFKGTNFKRYGSVNVYVADATGAEGSFEFYNCYSLEADTFRTSSPAYDPNGSNYEYFTFVTDGNNVSLWIGDTVKAIGKYNKYNTTYQLNTGCYLTEIIAGPRVEPDPAVDPDPIEGAITVAKAIELVNAMGDGKTSTHEFTVEGYVVNAEEFSWASASQLFFLADDAENSGNQVFEAYYCYGLENDARIALINGDKVQLTGHLQKYVKDAVVTPEISNAPAVVVEKAAGDRPAQPTVQEITVAQALTIGAGVEHNKLTAEYYSITGYITKFIDLSKDNSFWMADAADGGSDKTTAFEVYKPVFEGNIQVGDKVNIITRIKNYSQTIESETSVLVTVVEALQIDTINVAQAVDIALALEDNKETLKDYVILGYVAKIKDEYSDQYKNISFYMSDDATATYGELQVYRGKIDETEGKALAQGDRVMVIGKLKNNFYNDQNSAQTVQGSQVSVMWKQAIEHIVLTEKVNKVIMDGVLYIVRDGKLYNVQGALVR